jgi:hypothetical protein
MMTSEAHDIKQKNIQPQNDIQLQNKQPDTHQNIKQDTQKKIKAGTTDG